MNSDDINIIRDLVPPLRRATCRQGAEAITICIVGDQIQRGKVFISFTFSCNILEYPNYQTEDRFGDRGIER